MVIYVVVSSVVFQSVVSSMFAVDLFLMYSVVKRLGGYTKVKQPPHLLYLFHSYLGGTEVEATAPAGCSTASCWRFKRFLAGVYAEVNINDGFLR